MMAVTFCAAHRAPRSHTEPSFCWEMSPERSLPASKRLQTLGKSSGATPGSSGMAGTAPRAQGLWSVAPAGRAAEGTLENPGLPNPVFIRCSALANSALLNSYSALRNVE